MEAKPDTPAWLGNPEGRSFSPAPAALAALALIAFYVGAVFMPETIHYFRLASALPVALAAYREPRVVPALSYAALLGSVMVCHAEWSPGMDMRSAVITALGLCALALILHWLSALFVRAQRLTDAARESRALLDRAASSRRIAGYVCARARGELNAGEACLILRNPIQARWEMIAADGVWPVPEAAPGEPMPLAAWLVEKNGVVVVDDLQSDRRFARANGWARSLLALPLRGPDAGLRAVLALAHEQPTHFRASDVARLGSLISVAGAALEQAGHFAETGRRRDLLASQLAALQRAGRDLNAVLDPREIGSRALTHALRLTRAAGGAIRVTGRGLKGMQSALGTGLHDADAALAQAMTLDRPERVVYRRADGAETERLLVPLRCGGNTAGGLALEAAGVGGFDDQDEQAVTALMEHAGAALENARLLAQAETEREKSEQIIRAIGDGLVRIDPAGNIASVNPAAAAMLGRPAAELLGEMLRRPLGCDQQPDCASACCLFGACRDGTRFYGKRRTVNGRTLLLAGEPLPQSDDDAGGAIILLRDVTVEEANAAFQRDLLATFAHELRGPLANFTALAEVIADNAEGAAALPSREMIDVLRTQAARLSTLSQRTLDAARLDAGAWPLELRPAPVARLAREAGQRWQDAVPGRIFNVLLDDPAACAWADEEAVGLLLDNLIDNANKYAPDGCPITIAVEAGPPGKLVVAVEDGGAALPADEYERLFERFYRRERGDARATYGYGLGLYIVRRLARAMGGDAWGESPDYAGNRFAFSLPLMEDTDADIDR